MGSLRVYVYNQPLTLEDECSFAPQACRVNLPCEVRNSLGGGKRWGHRGRRKRRVYVGDYFLFAATIVFTLVERETRTQSETHFGVTLF